jgi:O-antigen/teichoic acid export membrane protein
MDAEHRPAAAAASPTAEGSMAGRILRNVVFRGVAELGAKVSTVALFVVMGHRLGDEGVGVYSFALSASALALTLADFGQDKVLTREVARDHSVLPRYYADTMAVRLVVGFPLLVVAVLVAPRFGYDGDAQISLLLVGTGVLVDLLANTTFAVFQAYERISYLSAVLLVERWLMAVVGITAILLGAGVVAVSATFLAASLIALTLAGRLLRRLVSVPLRLDPRRWLSLMRVAAPLGVAGLFGTVLFRIDTTMLALFTDAEVVGNYGAAYRLFETTLFVSWSVNTAFYPVFARASPNDGRSPAATFEHSLKLGLSAVLPVAVGFAVLSDPLIKLVFGSDFETAPQAVRLLAPAVCFYPVSYLAGYLIVSRNRERHLTVLYGAIALENVLFNLVVIPRYSLDGAAFSTSLSEGLALVGTLVLARRLIGPIAWGRVLVGPIAAVAPTAAVLLLLRSEPVVAAAAAAAVYLVTLVAVEQKRCPEDVAAFRQLLTRQA